MVLTGRYLTVTGGQVIMAAGLKPTPKPTVYNTDKSKKRKGATVGTDVQIRGV